MSFLFYGQIVNIKPYLVDFSLAKNSMSKSLYCITHMLMCGINKQYMVNYYIYYNIKYLVELRKMIWSIILGGSCINLFITLCLNIAWILVCMRECCRIVNRYLTCKRTPDLHPIYKDVQYLSRQRKLYNLETHIVKYVLVTLCMSVEVVMLLCVAVLVTVKYIIPERYYLSEITKYEKHCELTSQYWNIYYTPLMWLQNMVFFFGFLWFVLVSILTRYLAARYLNHPFYKTLYRYIVWISVQFCIVAFCSNKFTLIFSYFVFPLLSLINWLVLLRDNRILCRVLRSNLTELELHSNNRVLYHEQVSGYRCYRFFQKVLLATMLMLVVAIFIENSTDLFRFVIETSFCTQKILFFNLNYSFHSHIKSKTEMHVIYITDTIFDFSLLIYSLSSSLPIICITLIPLIRACVKRYKSRYMVYRYNYENTQPLIRR